MRQVWKKVVMGEENRVTREDNIVTVDEAVMRKEMTVMKTRKINPERENNENLMATKNHVTVDRNHVVEKGVLK